MFPLIYLCYFMIINICMETNNIIINNTVRKDFILGTRYLINKFENEFSKLSTPLEKNTKLKELWYETFGVKYNSQCFTFCNKNKKIVFDLTLG